MNTIKTTILILLGALFFGSLSAQTTTVEGVVINGITWATHNVDASSTFAQHPESAGRFYQWNRKTAWDATEENVSGWNNSNVSDDSWETENDPSPVGWRIPTLEELEKLLDSEKVSNEWTSINGVNGRKFTDKTTGNSIFLPAAGFRNFANGVLDGVNRFGGYWSSEPNSGYGFHINNSNWWKWYNYHSTFGFNIRPVKIED
jgi:uncharacterized protein (TIGR02145 family)